MQKQQKGNIFMRFYRLDLFCCFLFYNRTFGLVLYDDFMEQSEMKNLQMARWMDEWTDGQTDILFIVSNTFCMKIWTDKRTDLQININEIKKQK